MIRRLLARISKALPDKRAIRIACVLCLLSLAATVWAVLHPRPLVVIFAMSVGQGFGMMGVAFYAFVVLRDLLPRLKKKRDELSASEVPSAKESE